LLVVKFDFNNQFSFVEKKTNKVQVFRMINMTKLLATEEEKEKGSSKISGRELQ